RFGTEHVLLFQLRPELVHERHVDCAVDVDVGDANAAIARPPAVEISVANCRSFPSSRAISRPRLRPWSPECSVRLPPSVVAKPFSAPVEPIVAPEHLVAHEESRRAEYASPDRLIRVAAQPVFGFLLFHRA